jgi:hypothetical protein
MIKTLSPGQARKAITEQLEALHKLRNARNLDNRFKEWRTATYELAKRIWVSQPQRAERFRRVPFVAPMARPTDREAREWYERGCAEARALLRLWLAEIKVPDDEEEESLSAAPRLKDMLGLGARPEPMTSLTDGVEATASPPEPTESRTKESWTEEMLRSIIESAIERTRDEIRAADTQDDAEPKPESGHPGALSSDESPGLLVAMLAVEVEALDVPVTESPRVRGQLLELASHLQSGGLDWSVVQSAIQTVLPYPPLARRLIVLLAPVLDDGA